MTTYQCCCGLSAEEKYGGRDVGFSYPERKWPNRTIDEAPVLLSCDLRDGNQSLGSPMVREMAKNPPSREALQQLTNDGP